MSERWIRVAAADQVTPGQSLQVEVGGEIGLLHNVHGAFYCTGSVCPHQGMSLVDARLDGCRITCPWHAWIFDVTTGRSPYTLHATIGCLPVKVERGEVFVGL